MGRSSQLHKLNTHGGNSAWERKPLAKSISTTGTNTLSATVELAGLWSDADSITVTTNIGAGNVESVYSPSGDITAAAAATGLAAVINGKADHTASATENVVHITKSTAGTVTVVSIAFA